MAFAPVAASSKVVLAGPEYARLVAAAADARREQGSLLSELLSLIWYVVAGRVR